MAKKSFFAEKRFSYNDPNYFSRIPMVEIRKNVKRIIKDIKYDNIEEQDWAYFKNTQVIAACIAESQEQYTRADILERALRSHMEKINNSFPKTSVLITESARTADEHINQNIRKNCWYTVFVIFSTISNNDLDVENIKQVVEPIKQLNNLWINNL